MLVHHRQSADWRVYIFLAAATTSAPPPALAHVYTPSVSSSQCYIVVQAQTQNSLYSQCTPNYCVTRLRRLCSLWAFVRVGIGEEDIVQPPKPLVKDDTQGMPSPLTTARMGNQLAGGTTLPSASEKPPVPPRRRRIWEMASTSGERAVSWGKGSGGKREGQREEVPSASPFLSFYPHAHNESSGSRIDALDPPALPKHKVIHGRATTDAVFPPSSTPNGITAPEIKDPSANANGHIDPDNVQCTRLPVNARR